MIKTVTLSISQVRGVRKGKRRGSRLADLRRHTEFGAAWKKTAREGDRKYLSVKLDDPSFPAPLYASLVRVEDEENYSLIWSRRSSG
jgi:uncharacterized protein (DUF736 family)